MQLSQVLFKWPLEIWLGAKQLTWYNHEINGKLNLLHIFTFPQEVYSYGIHGVVKQKRDNSHALATRLFCLFCTNQSLTFSFSPVPPLCSESPLGEDVHSFSADWRSDCLHSRTKVWPQEWLQYSRVGTEVYIVYFLYHTNLSVLSKIITKDS